MEKVSGKIFDLKLFKKIMVFSKGHLTMFYFVMFSAIILSFFSTASPYLLKVAVDDFLTPKNYSGFLYLVCIMFAVLLLEVTFQFLFIYLTNLLGQTIIQNIRIKLFQKITSFKMAYFDKNAVGRLVTRSVSDLETIASIFSQGLFVIIADFLKMGLAMFIMLFVNWKLALIVFAILPILLYATRIFQKAMKKSFEEVRKEVANMNTFIQERIGGMKIVQLFSRQKYEQKIFEVINTKHKKAWLNTIWYNSIFFPIAEISSSIAIGLVVWYGAMDVIKESNTSLGEIFLFIQITQLLFRPLRQIADKFNTLQMGMVAAQRVFVILEEDNAISNEGTTILETMKGEVSFESVDFSYVEGDVILKNFNLKVNEGETIAIIGATGAGKSTIINLLSRFYEFDKGSITIDGVSIRNLPLSHLRKHIGIVLQDVFLFADTIYNNIILFDTTITREKVIQAAKEIGVHGFINSLPDGYDHNVKERGVAMSTGQRQLISFLRAYLYNPSILVLDEATSSVDSHSEELIQNVIEKLTKNNTSIVIAHRLATIQNADRIVVMEKGGIVEIGSHKELISKENGAYLKLYEAQIFEEK